MLIRQETQKDYKEVYKLIKEAFASAEHSDGKEQDLVEVLRDSEAFVPELSLVAQLDGKIVGHIMLTKAKVASNTVLVLAPLSVLPSAQKQKIGTALITKAHEIAIKLGYDYSFVLGSENYYPRFGYLPAEKFGIKVPEGIPSQNFMIKKLHQAANSINGAIVYAKEFGL